ncbi:ankyrin repeat-containing domain protein, partial [Baffinella frigidus]
GMPPLALAAAKGKIEMAKNLIHYNANINGTDAAGWTPLHHAVLTGKKDMVYFLLKKDADVTAKTTQGLLAEDLARTYNHTDI